MQQLVERVEGRRSRAFCSLSRRRLLLRHNLPRARVT